MTEYLPPVDYPTRPAAGGPEDEPAPRNGGEMELPIHSSTTPRPAPSIPPTGSPLIPLAALLENLRAMESQPSCTDGSWRPSEDYLSAIQEVSRDAERLAALGWTTSNIPAPSPVVEQPEPAAATEPVAWILTDPEGVEYVRKHPGCPPSWKRTPLYPAAPVLPPLPDGTGQRWVLLLDAQMIARLDNEDVRMRALTAAAVTHPTGEDTE